MARPATGSIDWRRDEHGVWRWHARITLKHDGSRPWVALDPAIPHEDEAGARACALATSEYFRTSGAVPKETPFTVTVWFKKLHAAKESKGLATVGEMRGRFKKWVEPAIGDMPIERVGREDVERIVAKVDAAIAAFMTNGPGKGRLSPATAANVWGDLQHAFSEAVDAKDASLRVLKASPCAGVRGPETGDDRAGQILYSDELLALLAGRAVDPHGRDVPMNRRRAYALAVYAKARASELEALVAGDVDLAHGTITIAKQVDRKSKNRAGTKHTKTKRVRTVDVEPNVRPLLELLVKHPDGKRGRLLHMPPPEDRAELLRKDLRTVGVTRAALHLERDPLQRAITLHDLRDTGLTHMAVRGDSPIVIQWAAGHTDFKTTQGYLDRGRVERHRIGNPLPPLPATLLGRRRVSSEVSSPDETKRPIIGKTSSKIATPMGIEPMLPT